MRIKNWLILALLLGAAAPARAWVFEEAPDKTVTVRYRLSVAVNTSTAAVLIDLSNTSSWPHKDTGEINISSIRLEVDKVAASTTSVKLGVVNFVDASTGSVTWFYNKSMETNVSNTSVIDVVNYAPNFVRLKAVGAGASTDGTTPYLLSSDKTSGSTIYQTDVVLPAPLTTGAAPGLGDVVVFVSNGTGVVVVNLEVQYHANKR